MKVQDVGVSFTAADIAYRLAFTDASERERRPDSWLFRLAAGEITADDAVNELCEHHSVTIDRSPGVRITSWDDYLIPGTLTLRNRITDSDNPLGIEDPSRFRLLELALSRIRMVELHMHPVQGNFDYDHSKAIHARIFQDIYHWAGRERIGPELGVVRFAPDTAFEPGDPGAPMEQHRFLSGEEMADAVEMLAGMTGELIRRPGLTVEEYVSVMAELSAELWLIHPYRDGNMRTGWTYVCQANKHVGLTIDPALFSTQSEVRTRLDHGLYKNVALGDHQTYIEAVERMIELSSSRLT